jgi:hypothetical protein
MGWTKTTKSFSITSPRSLTNPTTREAEVMTAVEAVEAAQTRPVVAVNSHRERHGAAVGKRAMPVTPATVTVRFSEPHKEGIK